mgnify:CR=1 FL=1
MSGALALAVLLSTPAAVSTGAVTDDTVPFDAKNYPLETLASRRKAAPCAGAQLKDVMFSAELRWHGALSKTPKAGMELLRRWTKDIGDPEAFSKYAEEVTLSEGRRFERVAVPEGLLAFMQMDLLPGDRVLLYLVHVGCAEGGALFAVDEYEVQGQDEAESLDELI